MIARRADRVGIIAESFRGYFHDAGVSDDRIDRLRTWTLGADTSAKADRSRFGWTEEDFVCLHAGNMGHKQGLENIVRAAALPRSAVITFILAGEGNDRRRLEDLAAANGAGIRFIGQQPPGAYEAMLASADVLIVNQRGSAGDMSLPSKLTSYFAAGRPVVAAVPTDGETAHEVKAAGAGLVVEPDDPEALADALLRLQADPGLRLRLGAQRPRIRLGQPDRSGGTTRLSDVRPAAGTLIRGRAARALAPGRGAVPGIRPNLLVVRPRNEGMRATSHEVVRRPVASSTPTTLSRARPAAAQIDRENPCPGARQLGEALRIHLERGAPRAIVKRKPAAACPRHGSSSCGGSRHRAPTSIARRANA